MVDSFEAIVSRRMLFQHVENSWLERMIAQDPVEVCHYWLFAESRFEQAWGNGACESLHGGALWSICRLCFGMWPALRVATSSSTQKSQVGLDESQLLASFLLEDTFNSGHNQKVLAVALSAPLSTFWLTSRFQPRPASRAEYIVATLPQHYCRLQAQKTLHSDSAVICCRRFPCDVTRRLPCSC